MSLRNWMFIKLTAAGPVQDMLIKARSCLKDRSLENHYVLLQVTSSF